MFFDEFKRIFIYVFFMYVFSNMFFDFNIVFMYGFKTFPIFPVFFSRYI